MADSDLPNGRFNDAKIRARMDRATKVFAEGDDQFAMEILAELEAEGHLHPELAELRVQIERSIQQQKIQQLLNSARKRMESNEYPLALRKLDEALSIDATNADALRLRTQAERERDEKQVEGLFQQVAEHRGDERFSQAREGLEEILKIDSENSRARAMIDEIDQARTQREAARNAYAIGRKSLEEKDTAGALAICEEYLQEHRSDSMMQSLKLEAEEMRRQERSATIADVDRRADAEPDLGKKYEIVKEAVERFPHEAHFTESLKLVGDRRDLVNSIVARAHRYEERGQLAEAVNQWHILRNIYPVYAGLRDELERLARDRVGPAKPVGSRADEAVHRSEALPRAEPIHVEPINNEPISVEAQVVQPIAVEPMIPEVSALHVDEAAMTLETRGAATFVESAPTSWAIPPYPEEDAAPVYDPEVELFDMPQTRPEPAILKHASASGGEKKPLWLVAGMAGAAVILGSIVYSLAHERPAAAPVKPPAAVKVARVQVRLTADQPGAVFKVDGAQVEPPVLLKPGEHTAEASLDGYSSDKRSFTISRNSSAPLDIAFALTPYLPELRFNSGMSGGSVILDEEPPVRLQDGAFSRSEIALGDHRVRVMDGGREVFSFRFHATQNELIKLTSPLISETNSGIVVSSLNGAAQIYATPGSKGGMEGQTLHPISEDGFAVPGGSAPQRVSVADPTGRVHQLTPDPSTLPTLTVFLNGGVERVPVTITANVPTATVAVNGKALDHAMSNGVSTLALNAGSWNIAIKAEGYLPSAVKKVVIKAGDQAKHLDFQLTRSVQLAALTLAGAPPEALVFLDEVRAGTVNSAGGFSKDVSPGIHTVAVRKAGLEEFRQLHDFKANESVKVTVQMRPTMAGVSFHVTPANAKITLRRDTDIYTPQNGQTSQVPAGSYVLTAAADDYKPRTETLQVEAGKPVLIDWTLQASAPATAAAGIPFVNAKEWKQDGEWMVHAGQGLSIFTGSGTHTLDIMKRKNKVFGTTKRTVIWADYQSKGNYTQYSLDGRNLYRAVYKDGNPSDEVKLYFGQDNGTTIRIIVELSPDSFVIKNRAEAVVDTIRKTNIGRFGFVDEVKLNVIQ